MFIGRVGMTLNPGIERCLSCVRTWDLFEHSHWSINQKFYSSSFPHDIYQPPDTALIHPLRLTFSNLCGAVGCAECVGDADFGHAPVASV